MHVPLMFLSEWREFPSVPCLVGKNLMTAHVSVFLKSCALPDMLPFSLCNKKRLAIRHMNRPLFPVTLLIPSYNIGKYVRLRTYQLPLVYIYIYICIENLYSFIRASEIQHKCTGSGVATVWLVQITCKRIIFE